jgi:uncharacterized membrane protein YhiD involved in acid resistance
MSAIVDKIKEVFQHMFTGIDNTTFDVVKIGGGLAIVAFIAHSAVHLYMTKAFDPSAFGIGISTIIGSIGAGVKLKEKSEPGFKE